MTKEEFDSDTWLVNYPCDICGNTSRSYGWSEELQKVLCYFCNKEESIRKFWEKNKVFHM